MKTNLPVILWDMDGVLVDTEESHYLAWKIFFAEMGRDLAPEEMKSFFGMNNAGIMDHYFSNEFTEEEKLVFSERKEVLFRKISKRKVKFLPGVLSWLEIFQQKGFQQVIASSAPMANIQVILDDFPHPEIFAEVISAENMPGKPDPTVFLESAKRLGARIEQCLVFEDSVPGVRAAKAAGMQCAAITSTNPREKLLEADLIFESFETLQLEQLKHLLPELNFD